MITKPHEVRPGVTVLYGSRFFGRHPYVNAVELGERERVLIDPGLCHEEYLRPRARDYALVVNTHSHPDHVSLNPLFACPLACHPLARPYIEDPARYRDAQGFPTRDLHAEWDRLIGRLFAPRP